MKTIDELAERVTRNLESLIHETVEFAMDAEGEDERKAMDILHALSSGWQNVSWAVMPPDPPSKCCKQSKE